MTTITIQSEDKSLMDSILYLLNGRKNALIKVKESSENAMLDFEKLDAETKKIVLTSNAAFIKNPTQFKTLKDAFPCIL